MLHIERYIDNTYLKGNAILDDFMSTYKGAFRALCTDEKMLPLAKKAKELFQSSPTKLAIVRNFPYGVCEEAHPLYDKVIQEFDVVIPHRLIRADKHEKFIKFLEGYYKTGRTIKWIIEEPLYTEEEIYDIVKFLHNHYMGSIYNNQVYIKTNSGFVKRKRTLKEVVDIFTKIVRKVATREQFGIKISGGISNLKDARRIAQRDCIIGSSKGLSILYEQQNLKYDNAVKRIIEG